MLGRGKTCEIWMDPCVTATVSLHSQHCILKMRCEVCLMYRSHVCAPAASRGDEGTSALPGPPSKVGLCIFNCDSAPEMSLCGSHGFTGIMLSTHVFSLVCCLT